MINYANRLDKAIKKAAWAHEQQGQHRKGTDIPYIIHPVGVMMIASNATDDEDILIACLFHDILEDVDRAIYSREDMTRDFGERVVGIVNDVTKDDRVKDWHDRSRAYLDHLENHASDEAVIVNASDKIHNLLSIIQDYKEIGEDIWQRFSTKSRDDQAWWYKSILEVITKRQAPQVLRTQLADAIAQLEVAMDTAATAQKPAR